MFEYALRSLGRGKRRTAAVIAGYCIAVMIITLVLTILYNGQAASDSVLSGTGTHFTAFIPSCNGEICDDILLDNEHEGFYAGSTKVKLMNNHELDFIRENVPVADAAPFIRFKFRNGESPIQNFMIAGVPADNTVAVRTNSCSGKDIIAGTYFQEGDTRSVVIDESFSNIWNLGVGSPIGIGGTSYSVCGIVNTGIRIAVADVYMPMEEAVRVINTRLTMPIDDQSSMFLFESMNAETHTLAVTDVKNMLGANSGILSYACWKPASNVMGITERSAVLLTAVVFLCLLAFSLQAGYAAMVERRRDFGILTSVGWSKHLILRQILVESCIQALSGWILGSVIACAVILVLPPEILVGSMTTVRKQIFPGVFPVSFLLVSGGGILAGIVPGLSMIRKNPAEALRQV